MKFSIARLNHYLWQRQGFDESRPLKLPDSVFGVYGTAPTCYLSLLARDPGFRFDRLDSALYDQREVVRTQAMRGSTFLVSKDLLAVTVRATQEASQRNYHGLMRRAGVSATEYDDITGQIERLLENQSLTAGEIRQAVAPQNPAVQHVFTYIIGLLCTEGRLARGRVRGGWKSNLCDYTRFDRWLPDAKLDSVTVDEARLTVAREYFRVFGPATKEDFRWWSGFQRDADTVLNGLKSELVPIAIEGLDGEYLILANDLKDFQACPDEPPQGVRLLPIWDSYLMAYRKRERYLADERRAYAYGKSGDATTTLLVNGTVGGVWDMKEEKKALIVKAAFFEKPDNATWQALEQQVERLAQAAGYAAAHLFRCNEAQIINVGSQNRFHSPLKEISGEKIFSI